MNCGEIIERIREIDVLVRQHRYDLALALTARLEEMVAGLQGDRRPMSEAVLHFLYVSRRLTEALIHLQSVRTH